MTDSPSIWPAPYGQRVTIPATRNSAPLGAVGLVVLGLLCQEVGASIAVLLFPSVGPIGMVSLRLGFSAIILLAICRPSLRGRSRSDWLVVVAFGLILATMNALFYIALERIPLGPTVTIEVLGPLVLSVVVSRRASAWLWAILAFAGVVLLSQGGFDRLDPIGVLFAVGAGACWAGYILMSAQTGRRFEGLDGLSIAMTIGAIVTIPFGIASAGATLFRPEILLLGAAVAVASSAIPYGLELVALRRLAAGTFSILMSVSPAIATLAGLVILHQRLSPLQVVAIVLVILASMGAVRSTRAHDRRAGEAPLA